jgi:hypothetical protein
MNQHMKRPQGMGFSKSWKVHGPSSNNISRKFQQLWPGPSLDSYSRSGMPPLPKAIHPKGPLLSVKRHSLKIGNPDE